MAAYADSDDMIARYDSRTLGDLCSDDGVRVSEANLATDSKMLAALNSASGKVKAAALRAGRYTAAELTALTGESLEYLKDITCAIAFNNLWRRRPYADDDQRQAAREDAKEALEQIRTGDEIFEVSTVIDAGLPKVDTITRAEITNEWALVVDQARGRFYPRRRSYRNR